jgi:NADPH:quinone reductase-like Zn-dependent oxidoreductase
MEAARQFVTERNGLPERYCFYLRNVRIHAALQIPDDEFGVEMVTNLQASSTSEGWLEFNISSVDKDGTKWTENASGLISIKTPSKKPLCRLNGSISPRRVDAQNWYVEFERIGLGYGKGFQCLSEIDSDPYKHLASARLQLKSTKDMFRGPESSYPIHPASLDACFQLAIIAIHGGQTGRMKHGFIPVSIDDLTVWPQADGSEDWAQTVCHTRMEGPRTARAQIQVLTPSGLPRVELSNLKAVSYYGGIDRTVAPESSEYSRLVWKPDIRTLTTENARRLLTSSNMTSTGDLFSQFLQIVDLASHRSPSMSVMEINGGSSMTEATLRTLGGDCNNKRYASYTVTNTSAEKLGKSENDLRLFKDVEHRVFDPSKRPTDQGFNTKFDYVLASAVSDLTPLATVLGNLRSLLKVGGRLVLMRCGSLDCFRGYLSGFGGVDLCLTSSKPLGNLMVATATEEKFNTSAAPTSTPQTVYIVHDHEPTPLAPVLEECLRSTGLSPLSLSLSNASTVLDNSRVIFTVDLEQKGLFDISESSFYQLKDIMMRCSSILWLTRDSPIASNVPAAALATGFIRTLPKERPEANFGIMHLDLKSTKTGKEELATFIAQQEAQIYLGTGELEYAIHDGVGYIPRQVFDDGLNARFRAINTPSTELVDVRMDEQEPAVVDFGTPGLIGSAHFKRDDLVVDPLKDDWIEIKVAAIGLTEKDIGADDGLTDVAGIVIKCGAGVSCFRPGNRVYALACSRLNTYVRVPASIAQPMASDDTFQNMASVPSAFCSAWYAFSHIAQVKKGQRIFIQSPTSNLGLAAIQVATALGAQIFVSVQTSVQAQYLQKNFAIPEENVFTISQTWDFAEKLLDLTRGTGFETIFSTTADDLNVSIGNCLAPRGLFIHVGKLNVQHRRSVALEILDRNATLSSFDLYTLSVQDLAFCSQ